MDGNSQGLRRRLAVVFIATNRGRTEPRLIIDVQPNHVIRTARAAARRTRHQVRGAGQLGLVIDVPDSICWQWGGAGVIEGRVGLVVLVSAQWAEIVVD